MREFLIFNTVEKCVLTETDEGSLVAGEAHPADQRGSRRPDTPVAVIHSKDVSSVQSLQVRPESTQTAFRALIHTQHLWKCT